MSENPGETLRRRALILSEAGYAPVPFWIGMTLPELNRWIMTHNGIHESRRKKAGKE